VKKILVTGGGGFIGSSLILSLQHEYEIISIDHGRNYPSLKKLVNNNVSLIKADICDKSVLEKYCKDSYAIIHLGGAVGERRCLEDIPSSMAYNIESTIYLLDLKSKYRIKNFIFSSSHWVYSAYLKRRMPLKEDDQLLTDTLYGYQKRIAEEIIKRNCLNYTIFRLGTVYGYGSGIGSRWSGVVGQFIEWASQDEPLIIYGKGAQKIDFIHIDDVIDAFRMALLTPDSFQNKTYNLGSGKPTAIIEVAYKIKNLYQQYLGKTLRIEKKEAPPGKIWPDKWLSINNIKKVMGNYPKVSLDEGLLDMILKYEKIS